MDFDPSKENIQPLRGGRNVTALEVALQAETNTELQETINLQRQNYERAIRDYQGDDPLAVWYEYIIWLEQIKHGQGCSLQTILQTCITKFDGDERYRHDLRFCKLIIKYLDTLDNPLELYMGVYNSNTCIGFTAFYRAWAWYHEAVGEYQRAHHIFEMAKSNNAQPADELVAAHRSLVIAAGEHMINGTQDGAQLQSKRKALMSLRGTKAGRVGSVRSAFGGPGVAGGSGPSTSNANHQVYVDADDVAGQSTTVSGGSLFGVKREEMVKENVMKPGVWTTCPVSSGRHNRQAEKIAVHEDGYEDVGLVGEMPKISLEDYSDWYVPFTIIEPFNDAMVPMYPKKLVYAEVLKEYSLEELRARRKRTHSVSLMDYSTCKNQNVSPNNSFKAQMNDSQDPFGLWTEPKEATPEKNVVKFQIFEDMNDYMPKLTSAMKTPYKDLNAEELAETGSRSGMDVAAAAPIDSAKRLVPNFEDSSNSAASFENYDHSPKFNNLSCNTEMFGNLKMTSTPNKESTLQMEKDSLSKRELFTSEKNEEKILSTILEETRSCYGSSSSSGGANTKSYTSKRMTTISEQHHSNLQQNLLANAQLRESLSGIITPPHTRSNSSSSSAQVEVAIHGSPLPLNRIPSDPFNQAVIDDLLRRVNFPGSHRSNCHKLNSIPQLKVRKETTLIGTNRYLIEKQLGRGTYGVVYRCIDTTNGQSLALKQQKPANKWEYYICRELRERLANHELLDHFMDVKVAYFSDVASILLSEFMPYGSLLDIANVVKQKTGKMMKETLCIKFAIEMLLIVEAMHQVKIIHADIKPDNFLIQIYGEDRIGLQLIDFGCSIDMSLFPNGTMFTRKVRTENFVCCEMLDGRPWSYHTDWFCVAATLHVVLFDKYIQMRKVDEMWAITNKLPRYARVDLWNMFFSTLLNQQNGPANVTVLKSTLADSLSQKYDEYYADIRNLINILKNR